jgi:hypothetical protein
MIYSLAFTPPKGVCLDTRIDEVYIAAEVLYPRKASRTAALIEVGTAR